MRVPGSWGLEAPNAGRGGGGGLGALGAHVSGTVAPVQGQDVPRKVLGSGATWQCADKVVKGSAARILNRKVMRKTGK